MSAKFGGICYCDPKRNGDAVICRDATGRYNPTACWYTCPGCNRRVPWCFGCDDDRPELCDDCWVEAHRGD